MNTQGFNLSDDIIYLNHAAVSPWPEKTVKAVQQFAKENGEVGSQQYLRWMQTEANLREQLRELINAPGCDEIALLKSTSEALSVIAYGLEWGPGDQIVIPEQEFPSNRIVWESLRPRGVDVVPIDLIDEDSPEDKLINAFTEHTRLLSVSSVQYATGLVLDLESLGKACKEKNILFCVDAIQSLGALPFDVQTCHADFVVADGHKWMLGPEGLALFYCRRALIESLNLNQYGWHMVQRMGDFDQKEWVPADSARRFECGSQNMLGIHALHASLSLILETGIEAIHLAIVKNTQLIIDNVSQSTRILSPVDVERRAGIVTLLP